MDIDKEKVWNSQLSALRSIQDGIKLMKDCIKNLESKVENEGVSGNYSVNSDTLKYAQKIWAGCLRLNELKKLEFELNGLDTFGLPKKTTTTNKE